MVTSEKAIEMIDEYLLEPNSINKDWVEALSLCKTALSERERYLYSIKLLEEDVRRLQEQKCIYNFDGEVAEYCVQPCPHYQNEKEFTKKTVKGFAHFLIDVAKGNKIQTMDIPDLVIRFLEEEEEGK